MTVRGERILVPIGVLAERFGLSPGTLRVWERAGRIPQAWRSAGGHRRDGEEHICAVAAPMGIRVVVTVQAQDAP
jgi:predicted site-specific integrase-resolvase